MLTKENLLKKKIALVTLGCDKNRVDAEQMLYFLKQFGFEFTSDAQKAEIVIVNTCAFLNASRKESLDTILSIRHNSKVLEKLVVTGCLSQKNYEELKQNLVEADLILPLKENKFIVKHILSLYGIEESFVPSFCNLNRVVSTPSNYAYLKIADGCDNFCSYCTIPFIRGRYKSAQMDRLVDEAKAMVYSGVKEIILIAQDVTKYGYDLYGDYKLVELIKKLSEIEGLKWIRLLYCYPELITDKLIEEIDNNPKVCKYIDIPLQHVSNRILKLMNRKGDKQKIEDTIQKLRNCKNYISIRSTFILGFPTEKRKEVKEIAEFLEKYKLNNVGFFAYSKEEGTKAYYMKKQIPNFIKNIRVKKLQKIQDNVIINNNRNLIGKTLVCVCEENFENESSANFYFRSEYNSPVIDTIVIAKNQEEFDV
ncbi:MAG: 30S ribosomal protein S12 methylthiotransferase RimO, partial [Christensenellales bacterium]